MYTTNHSNDRIRLEVTSGFPHEPSRTAITIDGVTFRDFSDDEAVELAEMLLIAAGQDDAALAAVRAVAR